MWKLGLAYLVIVGLGLYFLYSPILSFGYFPIDDNMLVFPPHLSTTPPSLAQILSIFQVGTNVDYLPVRDLAYLFQYLIGEGDPKVYHGFQLGLFIFLSLSFFLLMLRMKIHWSISFFTSLIWILHPLHVEQAAWISSQKDLLALVFGIWAVIAFYSAYEENRARWAWAALFLFVLSFLSKSSLTGLPLIGVFWFGLCALKKDQEGLRRFKTLGIPLFLAVLAGVGFGMFQSWFYSIVNDMRGTTDWSFRLFSAASAFGKSILAIGHPNSVVLELDNDFDWLSRNLEFFFPGMILLICFFYGFARSVVYQQKKLAFFLFAAILLYLPISGLVFPHARFFNIRYFAPLYGVLFLGIAYWINQAKLVRKDQFAILLLILIFLPIEVNASRKEIQLWSSPKQVFFKAFQSDPHSLAMNEKVSRVLRFRVKRTQDPELRARMTQQISKIDNWIQIACTEKSTKFTPVCIRLLTKKVTRTIASGRTQTSGLEENLYEIAKKVNLKSLHHLRLGFSLLRPELNLDLVRAWTENVPWSPLTVLRFYRIVSTCLLESPEASKEIHDHYHAKGIFRPKRYKRMVQNYTHSNHHEKLSSCVN